MALKFAVLATLTDGPHHGYRIRSRLHEELGPLWNISQGQVYATLGRLERDGLIVRVDGAPREYALSEHGRRALSDWLAHGTLPDRNDGLGFDDWLAQVAVCERRGDFTGVRRALDRQRQRCTTLRTALGAPPVESTESPALRLARGLLAAELEWLETVERDLATQAPIAERA